MTYAHKRVIVTITLPLEVLTVGPRRHHEKFIVFKICSRPFFEARGVKLKKNGVLGLKMAEIQTIK